MNDVARRNQVAQWAFDTRPVLGRFHLWLEDVEVERAQEDPVSAHSFTPRATARCLAMTAATTALGARLFGQFGEGVGVDKHTFNQVKKAADAISAYVMSEGLWYLTRELPENHALMVSLGEGLMPKAGETPEMGSNPLLGFGRVYARPQVARAIDGIVHRLLNEGGFGWPQFREALKSRGLTVWGAAVDTLENTSRFAEGKSTGPMAILHLFDAPLRVTRPYEAYMACLTLPRRIVKAAAERSVLLDFCTPRARIVEAIEASFPGIPRKNIHVWTLSGKSRAGRLSKLWEEWRALGAHVVEDGWIAPTGLPVFTDSGTYAPTCLCRCWSDAEGDHVFLCDGYAATAEALQAASLSQVFDVEVSMAPLSPKFELPLAEEYQLMRLDPHGADFKAKLAGLYGGKPIDDALVTTYASAIDEAEQSLIPLEKRVLYADDFFDERAWRVLSCTGYMCDDPYTGMKGVQQLAENRYRVTARLATHNASSDIHFTFRLLETLEETRLCFSPLLTRFISGVDFSQRPVKVSDSGRIRNELQTMLSQALEHDGDRVVVHFDRVQDDLMPRADRERIREALLWYRKHHPVWFSWLEVA
ncbi:MAG: hypothetical protein IAE78_29045 [Myxococcus sp.]|nr:hypothetical protein [Myxococcus sp.]